MRGLLGFLLVIVGALLVATALTYPAYQLIHPWVPVWRFDKIGTRLFDLVLLGGVWLLVRILRLRGAQAWGYGIARPLFVQQFLAGIGLGCLSMLPVSLAMVALGLRPLAPSIGLDTILHGLAAGAGSGLVVGLLEETLFRGLMHGAVIGRSPRPAAGILAVALIYAAVHFLAGVRIEHEAVTPHSGLDLLAGTLAEFSTPQHMVDAFLALTSVGILLGLVRAWTGNIALPAGLHAGWVFVMRATIGVTILPDTSTHGWLISRHDGYTGWLVLFASIVFIGIAVGGRRHFRRFRARS
jgi:uncharacterized protein